MTCAVIDEAVRNIVATGADPDYMAGLDNFCWCDPVQSEKTPDGEYKLAQLVRSNKALYEMTTAYRIPCISGKDSMKNDYSIGDTKISIPPTLLFTAIGIVPDVRKATTPDFKYPGDSIYLLGLTRNETGGSEYFAERGFIGNTVPKVHSPEDAILVYRALHACIMQGIISSCHDLSDGGLGIALAECCFSGGLGAEIHLDRLLCDEVDREDFALFSESLCRMLVSVPENNRMAFESKMDQFTCSCIGTVTSEEQLRITGFADQEVVNINIWDLKKVWQSPLGI